MPSINENNPPCQVGRPDVLQPTAATNPQIDEHTDQPTNPVTTPDDGPPGAGRDLDSPTAIEGAGGAVPDTIIDPATCETIVEPTDHPLLDELIAGLKQHQSAKNSLKKFALERVDKIAALNRAEISRFYTEIQERGVSAEWVRTDLRPTVNAEIREQKAHNNNQAHSAINGPTWINYVHAANELGHSFRINDLSDTLKVGEVPMSDLVEAELLSHLHARGLRDANVARRAFITDAAQNRYHPVKQYLESLTWDGKDHIAALAGYFKDNHDLIVYAAGHERTVIHAMLYRWLIGAVKKVYNPQLAQNPMLIFDGTQGKGKGYFVKWLCPLPNLHFEGAIRPEDKDYLGYLTQKWIWEVSELGATMRKADREALKSFITLQQATYRPPYGRYAIQKPAMASFIGTVNFDGALLNDTTGHRRFWPVEIVHLNWDYAKKVDVNQVWAQAVSLALKGEDWRLCPEEAAMHAAICERYEVEDVIEGYIRAWFTVEPENEVLYTHTTEIIDKLRTWAGVREGEKALSMKLSRTLNKIGLRKLRRDNQWGYFGIEFNLDKTKIQPTNQSS